MSNTAAVKRHRDAKLAEGYTHLQGFLPPDSSAVVRAMIEQGYAPNPVQACHVALLRMVQEDSK
jgi:hypothetical protein